MRTVVALGLAWTLSGVASAAPDGPRATAAQPAPVATASEPAREDVLPRPPRSRAIILGGCAGGALVLSAILGGVALARAAEQSGDAAHPQLYTRQLADHASEGRALAIASYVFLGLGVAAGIADAALWFETLRKPQPVKRSSLGGFGVGVLHAFSPRGLAF